MAWPAPDQYSEALQHPSYSFSSDELKSGHVETNALGLPRVCSGNFAAVYRMHCAKRDLAVRCFLGQLKDRKERYERISDFIHNDNLECTVDFHFVEDGIRINNAWYPVLVMDWVDGLQLNQYIDSIVGDTTKIADLASEFRKTILALEQDGIAHGDLQHGNIIVSDGAIRLVDYDGCYVPALHGQLSHELGHPNYQHPTRNRNHFGPNIDRFSAWMIYLSLNVLQYDSSIWHRVNGGDERLLFTRADYERPLASRTLHLLRNHKNAEVRQIGNLIIELLDTSIDRLPSLDAEPGEMISRPGFQRFFQDFGANMFRFWQKELPERDSTPPPSKQAPKGEASKRVSQQSEEGDADESEWYHGQAWQSEAAPKPKKNKSDNLSVSLSNLPWESPKQYQVSPIKPSSSAASSQNTQLDLDKNTGAGNRNTNKSINKKSGSNLPSKNSIPVSPPPPAKIPPAPAINPPATNAPPAPVVITQSGGMALVSFIKSLPTMTQWSKLAPIDKTKFAAKVDGNKLFQALNSTHELDAEATELVACLAAYRCLLDVHEAATWVTTICRKMKSWFDDPIFDKNVKRTLVETFILALENTSALAASELQNAAWLQGSYFQTLDLILESSDMLDLKALDTFLYVRVFFRFPFDKLIFENHLLNLVSNPKASNLLRMTAFKVSIQLMQSYRARNSVTQAELLKRRLRHHVDKLSAEKASNNKLWYTIYKEAEAGEIL